MIVVSNTSPLTNLAAIGQFDLLRRLYTELHICAAQPQLAAPVAPTLSEAEGLSPIPDHAQVTAALQSAPVMFVENVGQFPDPAGGTGDERARFQVCGTP